MDIQSLYYFSELAKDLHMTKTADRLFISTQTLSNHIKRVEDHYKIPLFTRKPVLALTYAGELVLKHARQLLNYEENLKNTISDIKEEESGIIRFGGSTIRLGGCLPCIMPTFCDRYPHVELRVTDKVSHKLYPLIVNGDLDYAIILSNYVTELTEGVHLINDQVYLCVSDSLLEKCYGGEKEMLKRIALKETCLENFSRLPFCIMSNVLGEKIKAMFASADITPHIVMNSDRLQLCFDVGKAGLAAFFTTHLALTDRLTQLPADMNILPVYADGKRLVQSIYLINQKGRYISKYEQYFCELVSEYFRQLERIQIERIVTT